MQKTLDEWEHICEIGPGRSKRNTLEDFRNKRVKLNGDQYFSEAFFSKNFSLEAPSLNRQRPFLDLIFTSSYM